MSMVFRNAEARDLEQILVIYARARAFMKQSGNAHQWGDVWPPAELIEEDIREKRNFVCEVDGRIQAVFALIAGDDPTYRRIEGAWLNDAPYSALHRVASRGEIPGLSADIFNWCFTQCDNIKIDTHEQNIPMQKALHKAGFTPCGKIWIEDGSERIAFQRTVSK